MRGLPFNISELEIIKFFREITDLQNDDIAYRYLSSGKFSGEVIVRFIYEFDQ